MTRDQSVAVAATGMVDDHVSTLPSPSVSLPYMACSCTMPSATAPAPPPDTKLCSKSWEFETEKVSTEGALPILNKRPPLCAVLSQLL